MSVTIQDGASIIKDPSAIRVYTFDWDDHLGTSVTISSSTFTVTRLSGGTTTALTANDGSPLGIQSGSRSTKVKISGGTLGARYRLDNTIVTNENPTQTIPKSCFILVQEE